MSRSLAELPVVIPPTSTKQFYNSIKYLTTAAAVDAALETCNELIHDIHHSKLSPKQPPIVELAAEFLSAQKFGYTQKSGVAEYATQCCMTYNTKCRLLTHEHWCSPYCYIKCRHYRTTISAACLATLLLPLKLHYCSLPSHTPVAP